MIKINDQFSIDGYSQGWQVTETVTTTKKEKNGGGQGTRQVVKYYPTIRHCLRYILDQGVKESGSIEDLLARLDKMYADINAAFAADPA